MKGLFLFSCLILTLSLGCNANVQSWCAKAFHPNVCISTIQSSPRNDIKNTPQGVAFILVGAAKANVRPAIDFINKSLKSMTYDDILSKLKGCLFAYNSIGSKLDFSLASLKTFEGRKVAFDLLNEVDQDVAYTCGWRYLKHHTPVVEELNDRIQSLSDSLTAASSILESIR